MPRPAARVPPATNATFPANEPSTVGTYPHADAEELDRQRALSGALSVETGPGLRRGDWTGEDRVHLAHRRLEPFLHAHLGQLFHRLD